MGKKRDSVFLEEEQRLKNTESKITKEYQNYINKARTIEDNVGSSITKMDAEIQKSLSHQKAENSRLDQQINQLKIDQNIIKNQLLIVQKRIEDIQLQIGQKY